jgi:hypothetical protein
VFANVPRRMHELRASICTYSSVLSDSLYALIDGCSPLKFEAVDRDDDVKQDLRPVTDQLRRQFLRISQRLAFAATVVLLACALTPIATAGAPVTKAQYQALLKQADARVGKVSTAAENGLQAKKSPAEMKMLILAWARVETQLGNSFKAVQPPAAAAAANALLSRGEILFGKQLTATANTLPSKASAIGPYLEKKLGSATGPRMIDKALQQLHKAGYGSGG